LTVDLFITCLNDALFPSTGRATVRILERLGHSVRFNMEQTCCGQMHFNTGYRKDALKLIRRFVEQFEDAEVVVSPSGSCVSMVREFYLQAADWAGDAKLKERVQKLRAKTFELSQFLVERLGVEDVGAYYPHRVTYHRSCHATRVLRVGDSPIRLLRKVKGLDLVELPDADHCCGFGGTFSVKNADTSVSMMADKISCILQTGAEACAAGDNSCLMHIGGGLSRLKTGTRTVHLAEILAGTEEEPFDS
jgi:L-lactate dehydrogenase complex protein LldE